MNVFVLDRNPRMAAKYQCDRHVVKMTLETAQICSTILGGPYKPTHRNHPCVIWAGQNLKHLQWLFLHGDALGIEYTHRYHKKHKSTEVLESLMYTIDWNGHYVEDLMEIGFVQCMPEQYKDPDPVKAYRAYYQAEKAYFAKWKNNEVPYWFKQTREVNYE